MAISAWISSLRWRRSSLSFIPVSTIGWLRSVPLPASGRLGCFSDICLPDGFSWAEFEELEQLQGCWLSNELIDAFPVHLVEMSGGELREVFVVNGDGGFGEELRPLSTSRLADYFSAAGISPVEGQRCEVNLAACDWMCQVAAKLERGFVLTIDYGYPDRELYAPWRQNGTLLCFSRHQASDNPYRLPGEQDITTHVDFSMLQRIGQQDGLETRYFGLQYQFLLGLGFVELLLELQAREQDERKAQALRMTLKKSDPAGIRNGGELQGAGSGQKCSVRGTLVSKENQ